MHVVASSVASKLISKSPRGHPRCQKAHCILRKDAIIVILKYMFRQFFLTSQFNHFRIWKWNSEKVKRFKSKKKLNLRWQTKYWNMSFKIQNVVSSCDSKVSAALLMLLSFYTEPWTSTNWRLFLLIYSRVSSYTICK